MFVVVQCIFTIVCNVIYTTEQSRLNWNIHLHYRLILVHSSESGGIPSSASVHFEGSGMSKCPCKQQKIVYNSVVVTNSEVHKINTHSQSNQCSPKKHLPNSFQLFFFNIMMQRSQTRNYTRQPFSTTRTTPCRIFSQQSEKEVCILWE